MHEVLNYEVGVRDSTCEVLNPMSGVLNAVPGVWNSAPKNQTPASPPIAIIPSATAPTVAGCSSPSLSHRPDSRCHAAFFIRSLCTPIVFMAGRAGRPSGLPVSCETGLLPLLSGPPPSCSSEWPGLPCLTGGSMSGVASGHRPASYPSPPIRRPQPSRSGGAQ